MSFFQFGDGGARACELKSPNVEDRRALSETIDCLISKVSELERGNRAAASLQPGQSLNLSVESDHVKHLDGI
jgi:hypothetical protein